MKMFCYQCQEASGGTGCTLAGVCGKTSNTSNLQDALVFIAKGVSVIADFAMQHAISVAEADQFVADALFMTITNANFDDAKITDKVFEGIRVREELKEICLQKQITLPEYLPEHVFWMAEDKASVAAKGEVIGVLTTADEDIRSLKELLTYGIKGMAAYAIHARNLGYQASEVYAFMHLALAATTKEDITTDELVALTLRCGEQGVQVMALLDKANTTTYGHPEITKVNIGVRQNPAILISGHDLKDLEMLLEQTSGTGVDVYTHSEMLPAHFYPAFKKYDHFVGNYGNAWWQQKEELESFNGPVLFTTNCIVPPKKRYKDRVYTTGASGFEGCTHIPEGKEGQPKDFSALIAHAKTLPPPTAIEQGEIVGGFAHHQVLALADKVVEAVETKAIRKFVVMAGCDGRMKDRDYYTDFARQLPKDTVILTAGCAKYRYNKLPLGDINGIPRVLDAGQCNDSYSLAVIALRLKEVFKLQDINDLPIAYNIAWYEQKAVIVLLALLSMGVKDIHLGPTLPAFLSPNVANVLIEKFGIAGIDKVETDLEAFG